MGDVGDDFRAMREHGKKKKQRNMDYSTNLLSENKIEFESKNHGTHLIVSAPFGKIDFWPSTGKWITRNGRMKIDRGVKNLLKYIANG